MKKIFFTALLTTTVFLITIISCQKNFSSTKTLPLSASEASNPDSSYTLQSSGGVVIKAYSTLNTTTQLIRRIDIYLTGGGVASFNCKAITTNTSVAIKDQVNNHTFTGTMTIETLNGDYLNKWTFSNGNLTGSYVGNPPYNPQALNQTVTPMKTTYPCTWSGVHGCVAQTINSMGPFSYLACLATAVECYAATWADCAWSSCGS